MGHLHWIPIDLPCEFSIENVILHLLAKTEGNRRGLHLQSLPNPAESLLKPLLTSATLNQIIVSSQLYHPRGICLQLAKQNDSVGRRRLFFPKNDNTIHTISFVSRKKSKTFVKGYPTCHHIQFNSIHWRLHIFSSCDFLIHVKMCD